MIARPQILYSQSSKDPAPAKPAAATTNPADVPAKRKAETHSELTLTKTIPVDTLLTSFMGSPRCDGAGNLYVRVDRLAITKFNSKSERIATFNANSSPDVPQVVGAGMFMVNADGEVYQLVVPQGHDRDVFIYNKDGSYKSIVKLDVGTAWSPSLFVVFPSGNFMAAGQKWDPTTKDYFPFTGIFSFNGTLLKELHLEDDKNIHQLAASGGLNLAISRGNMELGADGNVYLLRWLNPAVIYAISPGGEIVRRFTVDPGDQELTVGGMAIAGDRIAVVFRRSSADHGVVQEVIEIVDLEGNRVATYEEPTLDGHVAYGIFLACYSHNPERFTFLGWAKDEKLVLNITEPR
jgi:ribosomal protein L24E